MEHVNPESSAVQKYLDILQAIIGRMAQNSTGCKTWCITLVSAILVLLIENDGSRYLWIATIPVVFFALLDSYYLSLEREIRDQYNGFVKRLHEEKAVVSELFVITVKKGFWRRIGLTLITSMSPAIIPFYLILALMIGVVRFGIF